MVFLELIKGYYYPVREYGQRGPVEALVRATRLALRCLHENRKLGIPTDEE